eukprot:scaffold221763_cov27-Tisochrysis_lutea.AAC.1
MKAHVYSTGDSLLSLGGWAYLRAQHASEAPATGRSTGSSIGRWSTSTIASALACVRPSRGSVHTKCCLSALPPFSSVSLRSSTATKKPMGGRPVRSAAALYERTQSAISSGLSSAHGCRDGVTPITWKVKGDRL